MRIRQAKKIMKQVYKTRYWAYRQGYYCGKKGLWKDCRRPSLVSGNTFDKEVGET